MHTKKEDAIDNSETDNSRCNETNEENESNEDNECSSENGFNILKKISGKTEEHEFYIPQIDGYAPGKTKYIVVFGTVMSGLGKGIVSSSLGKLLQINGYTVAPIKLEGYLNIDSGTLNPFRHGEVFVLDDGMECV